MILRLIKNIKKILPHTWIIAGGPEVSYEPAALLEKQKDIDIVIMGEGEEPFRLLTEQFCSKYRDLPIGMVGKLFAKAWASRCPWMRFLLYMRIGKAWSIKFYTMRRKEAVPINVNIVCPLWKMACVF